MKARFKAEVEGKVVDSANREFTIDDFQANLVFQDGFLRQIALQKELTDDQLEGLVNEFTETSDPDVAGSINLSLPDGMYDSAKETLQVLESFMGLKGVKRIAWDEIEVQLIPETEEEEELVDVLNWEFSESIPDRPHEWEFDISETNWEIVSDLKIPLAFFRRAQQFHLEQDFVNSYVNLYFILEGLYADGQHTNVESKFLDSDELMSAVEMMYPDIESKLRDELEPFFEFYSKDMDPEGFIELVVTIRHQLSHFFHKESGPHSPDPFSSDEYRPLSTALLSLCVVILEMKVNEIPLE